MISDAIHDQLLCDELQCPGELNRLVHSGDRAQFHLLLSMLCQDVAEQPQFAFTSESVVSRPSVTEAGLRNRFGLQPAAPLCAKSADLGYAMSLGKVVREEGNHGLQLALSIHPEPLAFYDDPIRIDSELLEQVDTITRLRYEEVRPAPRAEGNTVTMYDVLSGFDYDQEITLHRVS